MYKVIITDLDRTLLRTDKTISPYTLQVLKRCKEKGILLLAATARPLRAIEEYRRLLDFDALTVMNGAKIICGNRVESFSMSKEHAEGVLEKLCRGYSWEIPEARRWAFRGKGLAQILS